MDVAHSLGKRLSVLETKGSRNPPSSDIRGEVSHGSDQDAKVETRLLKLETQMDGLAANTFVDNLTDGAETMSMAMARIEKQIAIMDVKLG